jgi:hypothetical protein
MVFLNYSLLSLSLDIKTTQLTNQVTFLESDYAHQTYFSLSEPSPSPPQSPAAPGACCFPMAAQDQEAKPDVVTPTPAGEPRPDPAVDVPSAAADVRQEMQPWEQHSAVINLPRYDYRASGSLLLRSCSGFLITCLISACPLQFSSLFRHFSDFYSFEETSE